MAKSKKAKTLKAWYVMSILVIGAFMAVKGMTPSGTGTSPSARPVKLDPLSYSDYAGLYDKWGRDDRTAVSYTPDLTARNYYVVLDTSGSMNEGQCAEGSTKMQVARESLKKWIATAAPGDNVALSAFGDKAVEEIFPLQKNTPANRDRFIAKLDDLHAGGGTPLGASLAMAYEALAAQAQAQRGYGEYHIVAVTDGIASDQAAMEKAVRNIYRSPVVLHTIGFCINENHALNRPGLSYYTSAMNGGDLERGLQQVLAESETFDVTGFSAGE